MNFKNDENVTIFAMKKTNIKFRMMKGCLMINKLTIPEEIDGQEAVLEVCEEHKELLCIANEGAQLVFINLSSAVDEKYDMCIMVLFLLLSPLLLLS